MIWKTKKQCKQLVSALLTLSKLVAPFIPFMAEHITRNVRSEIARVSSTSAIPHARKCSILQIGQHFPMVDHTIIDSMATARKNPCQTGLVIRAKSGVKVDNLSASFTYTWRIHNSESAVALSEGFPNHKKEELNVKKRS